tara:strand:- start:77 stop:400 length:324 start_codon:yes stop_codon:yes gene_type:complete
MSRFLGSGPYTCSTCDEEYYLNFIDEKFYKWDSNSNPKFARMSMCESCGIQEAAKNIIELLKKDRMPAYLFREMKFLEDAIDTWEYLQRDKCSGCKHERDGCQTHDQ